MSEMQYTGGDSVVYKKYAGRELYACNSLYFWSKRNLTISDKNSCILNMQRGITKRTQINSSWTGITASLVSVLQNMKTGNDGTECIEKQSRQSILPPNTLRWFAIAIHTANQRIQLLRQPTANLLRLRTLDWSRKRLCGSESFRHWWTHRTDLFPTSSEASQMLQTSNGWAGVFLPLGLSI